MEYEALTRASTPAKRVRLARRILGWVAAAFFVALVAAWLLFLLPQALGGATGYVIVSGPSMHPVLYDGDVALVRRQSSYEVGDVVVYRVPRGHVGAGALVVHRIVSGSPASGYVMRGDNKPGDDEWRPRESDIVGEVRWRIPQAGGVLTFLNSTFGLAAFAGLVAFALAFPSSRRDRASTGSSGDRESRVL